MKRSRTSLELGDLGESVLENWCAQVGIVHNKAKRDRTGWDHYLEFPYDDSNVINIPLDKQKDPIRCWIQVKSTDTRPGKISVKLSNWDRLIKKPEPSFFLILEFDGERDPRNAYLVHIDKDDISRVLKRQRKLGAGNQLKQYKHKIQLNYSKGYKLDNCTGEALEFAIKNYVGDDTHKYIVYKSRMIKEIGYEQEGWVFNFTAKLPKDKKIDPQEYMVDFIIGRVPHLDITDGNLYDNRFGIKYPHESEIFKGGGRLELIDRKPDGTGKLSLINSNEFKNIYIVFDVYLPRAIKYELDKRYYKLYYKSKFIDVIFQPYANGTIKFDVNIPGYNEIHSLKDMIPMADFILLVNDCFNNNVIPDVHLYFNDNRISYGKFDNIKPFDSDVYKLAKAIKYVETIALRFKVHDRLDIKINEIVSRVDKIKRFSNILNNDDYRMKIAFNSHSDRSEVIEKMCCPFNIRFSIGEYHILVGLALIGKAKPTGEICKEGVVYELISDVVVKHYEYCFKKEEFPKDIHEKTIDKLMKKYEDDYTLLLNENNNLLYGR
jgi:hypothetical protein